MSCKFLQITIASQANKMDFDAWMTKKLGGKYSKPIQGETDVADISESAEDGGDGIILTPLPNEAPAKTQTKGQKKATLKPRVMCSQCDFVGIDGSEMERHRREKHEQTFCCNECGFVATYKVVLRRHQITQHNQKCKSCDFSAATSASLKMHKQAEHGGGLLRNAAGFMITNDAIANSNEETAINEEPNREIHKKKMTKCEYHYQRCRRIAWLPFSAVLG